MKEIMKVTIYDLKKIRTIRTTFLTVFFCMVVLMLSYHFMEPEATLFEMLDAQGAFLVVAVFVSIVTACLIAGIACGNGFKDKTIHYELLYGHSRKQVYFGRLIPGLALGILFSVIILVVPFCSVLFFVAPGEGVEWRGMFVRALLLEINTIRMCCEMILLVYLLRSVEIASLVYFGLVILVSFLEETVRGFNSWLFGISNIGNVLDWVVWRNYRLDHEIVKVYQYMPETEVIWKALLYSGSIGIICIVLGYGIFSRDDMN